MTLLCHEPGLLARLDELSAEEFDELPFGVIGFDEDERVSIYNTYESGVSGLDRSRVLGQGLFVEVAPCTNNALIAERFRTQDTLDEELDYVFTFRMRPTPVRLRLLAQPSAARRYMVVARSEDA